MQAEERDLIIGLFDRLRPFDSQPRDPEAERLIADGVARQPSTPYLLTQTVLVQDAQPPDLPCPADPLDPREVLEAAEVRAVWTACVDRAGPR